MKTDYERLGGEALKRLEMSTKNADTAQTKFLLDWLNENKNTEFGKRYGFAQIKSVREYQKKVPLSVYDDYARDIERIIDGEKNILTARDTVYFCISSGTVGDEKYIPNTISRRIILLCTARFSGRYGNITAAWTKRRFSERYFR